MENLLKDQPVDYSTNAFNMPVIRDGIKGYASVNEEYYPGEDGLERTGNYFVYLLHPKWGSKHFMLEFDEKAHRWVLCEPGKLAGILEDDLLREIGDKIESRLM